MKRTRKIVPGAYEVLNTGAFRYRVSARRKNTQCRHRKWNIYKAEKAKGAKWELIDDDFSTKEEAVDWALDYAAEDNKKIEAKAEKDGVSSDDYERQEFNTREVIE
jgi:hypothetical protein